MRVVIVGALAGLALAGCAQEPAPLTGEALVQRGDYLVNGVVLCGDCHTPRFANEELDHSRRLHGAPLPGPPHFAQFAPQLAGGPANYSEAQFISFLQDGVRPDGSHPMPPMPPYRLNVEDARAVSAYIRSLPAAPSE